MSIPRPEYPRPQFVRDDWLCLNGPWQFEIDPGDTGLERGLKERDLKGSILVPFCPESELSRVGCVDFMEAVWYRREALIPAPWAGQRILLHFQAVDYDATVWVNGAEVGRHRGGFSPFTCDLSNAAQPGETAVIVVRARDPRGEPKPAGKQSPRYANFGCRYTRTTGIWQTVWLEPAPAPGLDRARITPDVTNRCFHVEQPLVRGTPGLRVRATLSDDAGTVAVADSATGADLAVRLTLGVPEDRVRLWAPGAPHLYDLAFELLAAKAMDVSRPVLDASGYSHRVPEADVYDCHDYEQDPEALRRRQAGLAQGEPYSNNPAWSIAYRGQPFFVSEFGGIWWNPEPEEGEDSWGYGQRPASIEEFYRRFDGLCGVLLDNPDMFGYCYTQLTDVFQEQNGVFFFDRRDKFDLARLRQAQTRPAAIESPTQLQEPSA